MRFLIPTALLASLLIPAAAMACPNCIVHGSPREDTAWTQIVGRKNPAIPAPATESAKVKPAAKPAAKPAPAKRSK